jgi:heat shock protein HslJ
MHIRTSLQCLLLSVLLLACGDSGDDGLAGRVFLLESADGFSAVSGTTVRLSFSEDDLSVSAGCNSMSGPYRVEGKKLVLAGLGSTEIGCDAALHDQDERLADFFSARPSFELSGERLELSEGEITLRFLDREQADPDRPLVDTQWEIDSYIEGNGVSDAPASRPASKSPTVHFASDGTVHVMSSCNGGGGRYTVKGDRITLLDIGYSEEGCNDAAAASVEQKVQAVLREGTLTFEIEARRLTLMRGDVGLSALAR